jgi:hypothetical protein
VETKFIRERVISGSRENKAANYSDQKLQVLYVQNKRLSGSKVKLTALGLIEL